jgi:hypothetical protein
MFLWFGINKYVVKALELKMLHEPLSADQQAGYDAWIQEKNAEETAESDQNAEYDRTDEESVSGDTQIAGEIEHTPDEELLGEEGVATDAPTMELPEVKTVDVGQYNTINLQMALAESMKEILEEDETEFDDEDDTSIAETLIAPLLEETAKMPAVKEEESAADAPIVQFPAQTETASAVEAEPQTETASTVETEAQAETEPAVETEDQAENAEEETDDLKEIGASEVRPDTSAFDAKKIMQQIQQEMVKPSAYDNILSQEYDGQLSLVVPETESVEKQITGQLSIDDIMAEWEEMKRNNEKKRREDVRKHILEQTGSLFANFDEATKNGLLEELEKAFMAAILQESKKPPIKKVIMPDDDTDEKPIAKKPIEETTPEPTQEEPIAAEEETDGVEELEEIQEPEEAAGSEAVLQGEQEPEDRAEQEQNDSAEAKEERELTPEEQELFGQFAHHRKTKRQLVNTLDNMSLAACTGNVVITGEEEITTLTLAKALIREMQYNDNNFSGKVAKITGSVLNKKDIAATFGKLDNGALIIEKASAMKPETVEKAVKVLEKDNQGLFLLMTDTKKEMNRLLAEHAVLFNNFNLRVDIEPLDDEALVAYAKQYAEEMEYSIDEFGILALHTRISEKQTSDHEVTLAEIRELVDEAIHYANKKTPGHLMDILLAKRYDEEDMIILREKDFMHY